MMAKDGRPTQVALGSALGDTSSSKAGLIAKNGVIDVVWEKKTKTHELLNCIRTGTLQLNWLRLYPASTTSHATAMT
jgi:hypothetical protein